MAYQAPTIAQIVMEVNRHDFKKQVTEYNGDRKVSKLDCFGILVALACAHPKNKQDIARYRHRISGGAEQLLPFGVEIAETIDDRGRPAKKTGGVQKDRLIRVSGTKKDEYPDYLRRNRDRC
jgi:hypothetical protein